MRELTPNRSLAKISIPINQNPLSTMIPTFARCILFLLALSGFTSVAGAKIQLAGPFSDHMVLQRDKPIPVWGWAEPGELVTVTLNGTSATATADDSGKWLLNLPAMSAGVGYSMIVSSDQTETSIEVSDVVIGEVWLASGQSNMQWKLANTDPGELTREPNPMIRQYRGASADFRTPTEKSSGKWVVDEGDNRLDFSAVAYYFAQSLQEELDVPVGILLAAVGGTKVETWMDREVVESIPGIREESEEMWAEFEGYPALRKSQQNALAEWRMTYGREDPDEGDSVETLQPSPDAEWLDFNISNKTLPETDYSGYGVVWMRNTFEVTADAIDSSRFYFRFFDEYSFPDIFINGKLIQETTPEKHPGQGKAFSVFVSKDILKVGTNEILLRVDSPTIVMEFIRPLRIDHTEMDRDWQVQVEVDYGAPSEAAQASLPESLATRESFGNLPSVHYNRQIYPKKDYAIRGFIWYQGESNTWDPSTTRYAKLFPAMIESWRELWGDSELPFYFCQLANYSRKSASLEEDSWASLRSVQTDTLRLPHTGQAILIDTGEVTIHPFQKKSAGERLARLALARTYGKDIVDSGPVLRSWQVESSGVVRLSFDSLADGLYAAAVPEFYYRDRKNGTTTALVRNSPDSELEGFALQDEEGNWHWAEAEIDGENVLVWAESVEQPIAVRYNWQRNPSGNLFNSEDLPAGPFQVELN